MKQTYEKIIALTFFMGMVSLSALGLCRCEGSSGMDVLGDAGDAGDTALDGHSGSDGDTDTDSDGDTDAQGDGGDTDGDGDTDSDGDTDGGGDTDGDGDTDTDGDSDASDDAASDKGCGSDPKYHAACKDARKFDLCLGNDVVEERDCLDEGANYFCCPFGGNTCTGITTDANARCVKVCLNRVLILLDRSASMDGTKWTQAKDAISYLTTTFPELDVGLSVFATDSNCAVGAEVVQIAPNNGTAIQNWLTTNNSPDSNTPLWQAMNYLHTNPPVGFGDIQYKRSIIIITDGSPNCSIGTGARNKLITSTTNLVSDGYKVYIIGFGSGVNASYLNAIAQNGGTTFTTYFIANDTAGLQQAFDAIAGDLHSC